MKIKKTIRESLTEEENLQEEVKTEWTDKIFLDKVLKAVAEVGEKGAKFIRCLDCTANKCDLYNITDIQFTSSLLDPENKSVTKVCIVFDNDASKKCETVEDFAKYLQMILDKVEENNKNNISVSFAFKSPNEKNYKQYRYYYDDTNDTVLLAVNVPQIKLIQNFCATNPSCGNVRQLAQAVAPEVADEENVQTAEDKAKVAAAADKTAKANANAEDKAKTQKKAKKPAAKKPATKKA